ncbi:DUF2971 domain-containing protein [Chitinimonas taiwanensis]|uniref:DUF2971 domain-containing protein n=1 Tax=Chitinimonas taiwanensis TaxID=240412 RepID=UPI0035B02100
MRLFKYCSPDRIDVLRDRRIRFSSPLVLNDPFELKPHFKALATQSYLECEFEKAFDLEIKRQSSVVVGGLSEAQINFLWQDYLTKAKLFFLNSASSMMPAIGAAISSKFEEMIGILCLTEDVSNLLMWAHYADSHKGFVIEFDPDSDFFDQRKGDKDEFRFIRKVLYQEVRPSLTLMDLESFEPFLTKGKDWEYEREWRMMLPLADADHVIGQGGEAVHLFSFPAAAIKAVFFGERMDKLKCAEIMSILDAEDCFSHVECHQVKIDDMNFRLNMEQVARNI